jgi:[ribosomal protein S5]-alanine N-acetyltransferase
MRIPLPIGTERLLVRPFAPESDARAMAEIYCDPEVMRFIPGGALADEEAARSLLERYADAQARQGFSSWAVVERRTARLIGDVGLGIFEPTGDVELGYTLACDYWGLGYASEAAKACLAAALAHLDVPRIVAVVDLENEASLRVPERIGMTRTEIIEAHGRPHALFVSTRSS